MQLCTRGQGLHRASRSAWCAVRYRCSVRCPVCSVLPIRSVILMHSCTARLVAFEQPLAVRSNACLWRSVRLCLQWRPMPRVIASRKQPGGSSKFEDESSGFGQLRADRGSSCLRMGLDARATWHCTHATADVGGDKQGVHVADRRRCFLREGCQSSPIP